MLVLELLEQHGVCGEWWSVMAAPDRGPSLMDAVSLDLLLGRQADPISPMSVDVAFYIPALGPIKFLCLAQ